MGVDGADTVELFAPLLQDFIASGGHVDEVTPRQLFRGRSLATIACLPEINAPRCLQALIDAGADVVTRAGKRVLDGEDDAVADSVNPSRETPIYNAILTAITCSRDERCLDTLAAVPGASELIHEERLKRLIYDVLHFLTQKAEDLPGRRKLYRQIFVDGFQSPDGCCHSAADVAQFLAPMVVVPTQHFQQRTGIPRSSERLAVGTELVEDDASIVFFSHRWLTPHSDPTKAHPDDEVASKWGRIAAVMELVVQNYSTERELIDTSNLAAAQRRAASSKGLRSSIEPEKELDSTSNPAYLWLDYSCIEQDVTKEDFQHSLKLRGINSLPIFIFLCSSFVALEHEQYANRAWCRLEMFFAACFGKKRRLLLEHGALSPGRRYGFTQSAAATHTWVSIGQEFHDPRDGALTSEADRPLLTFLHYVGFDIAGGMKSRAGTTQDLLSAQDKIDMRNEARPVW